MLPVSKRQRQVHRSPKEGEEEGEGGGVGEEGGETKGPENIETPFGITDDVVNLRNGKTYHFFKLPHKVRASYTLPLQVASIRASVDTLCRDDTSEISRDPGTKRLLTPRERLARP